MPRPITKFGLQPDPQGGDESDIVCATPGAEEIRGTPKLSEKRVSRESSKQHHHNNS
jgi:hypothetical protein